MGQTQTRDRNSLNNSNQRSSRLRNRGINNDGFCNISAIGPLCFNYSNRRTSSYNPNNVTWKQHLVEQLQGLDVGTWPQLLLNFLETNNTEANDVVFQSEFFWADFNSAKKPVHYSSKALSLSKHKKSESFHHSINHPEEDPIFHNQFAVDDNNQTQEPNKKDFTQDIKNMIAASDILEEKVFNMTDNETWIQKSFNIRPYEEIKSRNPSIDHIKISNSFYGNGNRGLDQVAYSKGKTFLEPLTKEERMASGSMKSIHSVDSGMHETRSRNSLIERYENNTFIVQQQPEKDLTLDKSKENQSEINPKDNSSIQMTEEEKLYKAVVNYKTLTGIIDQHLKQKNNTFGCLMKIFEEYYEKAYGDVSKSVKEGNLLLSEVKHYISDATRDLQQFIRIIYEGITLFYKLEKIKVGREINQGALFNRDNMLNFITSIIFSKKIHDTIFKLYQIQNLPIEETYEKSLKRCQNLNPQDFGVPDEFCLNERTVTYIRQNPKISLQNCQQMSKMEAMLSESPPENEIIEMVDQEKSQQNPSEKSETNENKTAKSQLAGTKAINNKPYNKAIETLKALEHRKSPLHKLKTIVKVAEFMGISIQEFYKENNSENTKKLDADQTLIVLMYILAKSGLNDVTTHCKIIENFTTNNILDSVSGYYATTLEACVNCICSISLEKTGTEEGISPTSGDFNQFYSSMPSWGGGKQMNEAGSIS